MAPPELELDPVPELEPELELEPLLDPELELELDELLLEPAPAPELEEPPLEPVRAPELDELLLEPAPAPELDEAPLDPAAPELPPELPPGLPASFDGDTSWVHDATPTDTDATTKNPTQERMCTVFKTSVTLTHGKA